MPILLKILWLSANKDLRSTETLLFGGLSPPNKKYFLCVLGASVVKILFWML